MRCDVPIPLSQCWVSNTAVWVDYLAVAVAINGMRRQSKTEEAGWDCHQLILNWDFNWMYLSENLWLCKYKHNGRNRVKLTQLEEYLTNVVPYNLNNHQWTSGFSSQQSWNCQNERESRPYYKHLELLKPKTFHLASQKNKKTTS